jgi:hypothetical protein
MSTSAKQLRQRWKGRRQSTNIEDRRFVDQRILDLKDDRWRPGSPPDVKEPVPIPPGRDWNRPANPFVASILLDIAREAAGKKPVDVTEDAVDIHGRPIPRRLKGGKR